MRDSILIQKERIIADLVTNMEQVVGTDNPNFDLLINDQ